MQTHFTITIHLFHRAINRILPHKMHVEIYYFTDEVHRYRVHAGGKELLLQKFLHRTVSQWSILGSNYKYDHRALAECFEDIKSEIDRYIAGPPPRYEHWKNR